MSLKLDVSPVSNTSHVQNDRDRVYLSFQNQQQVPPVQLRHHQNGFQYSCKRRLSEEASSHKRCKPLTNSLNTDFSKNPQRQEYPKFSLPDGSSYEQTPYGNLRTVNQGNAQVSMIDNGITLNSFTNYDQIPNHQHAQTNQNLDETTLPTRQAEISDINNSYMKVTYKPITMTPSPSLEIESYMIEGYRDTTLPPQTSASTASHQSQRRQLQGVLNRSYDIHRDDIINVNYNLYDQSNEDLHLIEDQIEEDFEMGL